MPEHRRRLSTPTVTLRALVVAGCVVAAALALYLGAALAAGDGVRAGTTVAGVSIGGLSQDEAVAKLDAALGKRASKPLKVQVTEHEFAIKPQDAGLSFDAEATVAAVSGRTWNPIELAAGLLGSRAADPVVRVDEEALRAQVEGIATSVDTEPVEPALAMDGTTPVLTPGKQGYVLDEAVLRQALVDSLLEPRAPIQAALVSASPTVTPEAADEALALAEQAVSAPVIVSASDITATLRPKAIARALSFTSENGQLAPQLDGAVLHAAIEDDLAAVETPGRDARFKIKGGKPVIVPSKVGTGISDDELAAAVVPVLGKRTPDRAVSVSIGTREPKLSTEEAEALCITERMSTFTQRFPYAAYRVQNIGQAAKYVNGTILRPGEVFSMNQTMKERTAENGYTEGFIIAPGGVFAEEMGGGVSAATTTVWTGAFFAGLERVFTQAHSIYISRYQPGLEATVSWGNFDMKFKNDTPCGVLITTSMSPTSMTVSFWGSKQYDDVDAEFGPRRDITKFATVYDKSKECLGQEGVKGFTIDVDRVFRKDGKEVDRETITTRYRATPKVVCGEKKPGKDEGKKGAGGTASPSPSPSGSKGDKPKAPADQDAPAVVSDAPKAAR